ncbi:polysaccharide deacetylase family protein [Desulfolutivibrio sulfoxidireducens]|uniref:polysaccharide deacetylase family protein n=1 Tax=Desulfolutivibrio sulfoxidireducens TaxID=2773299 RepID=UPI00159D7C57|nr:polysaccharide deacetylase family protein [Desulfolutivibrio sulfoxidireducens]QLA20738.1 polysaccharide deacetylase family protein [Desulfolutivibrio sulfoxidireducens]
MKRATLAICLLAALLLATAKAEAAGAGMLTLTFDDGLRSVHSHAFPILQQYGIPATTGIIAARLKRGDDDFMSVPQVRELVQAGWEVASHGLTHRRPVDIPEGYAQEGLKNCRRVEGGAKVFEARYGYEDLAGLTENGRHLKELDNEDDVKSTPGSYYFDDLIGEVVFRPLEPDDVEDGTIRAVSYEREMEESREVLAELGFAAHTYITPHNYWTTRMRDKSRSLYDQVVTGGDDGNFPGRTDRWWIKRHVVHTADSAETIIALTRKVVVEQDGWLVLCLHGVGEDVGWEPWSSANLSAFAAWLRQSGVTVVTIAEGAKRFFGGGKAAS